MSEPVKKGKTASTHANDRQVGGDHYQTGGLQLWDMYGPEALMFYATRYVARWRKKDGVKDLEKGKHTVEKLLELGGARRPSLPVERVTMGAWAKNQGCDWVEQTIIMRINFWESKDDIKEAIKGIEYLIETVAKAMPVGVSPRGEIKFVPLHEFDKKGVVVTNTPRPGETEAQIAARERRVPRFDQVGSVPGVKDPTPVENRPASFDVGQGRISVGDLCEYRQGQITFVVKVLDVLQDGEAVIDLFGDSETVKWQALTPRAVDAPTYSEPWVVSKMWLAGSGLDTPLIEMFWTRRGEVWVLEPHSTNRSIPRVLRHCYNLSGDGGWTLDVRKCPPDARDYFPSLQEMRNQTEWEELTEWQRELYMWNDAARKYVLTEITSAWHVEED